MNELYVIDEHNLRRLYHLGFMDCKEGRYNTPASGLARIECKPLGSEDASHALDLIESLRCTLETCRGSEKAGFDTYWITADCMDKYIEQLEQAIATLGSGTCRNVAELNEDGVKGYFFVCSECGLAVHACFGIDVTNYPRKLPDGSADLRVFNSDGKYEFERCPRCGRKAVDE